MYNMEKNCRTLLSTIYAVLIICDKVNGFSSYGISLGNQNRLDSLRSVSETNNDNEAMSSMFEDFCTFLTEMQTDIISQIESHPCNKDRVKFCSDAWSNEVTASRGLTRVIQPSNGEDCFIEKGAVSTTFLENGVLSLERAKAIQGRRAKQVLSEDENAFEPQEGDIYKAAALSLVLHTKSPNVPTFRSDIRVFVVQSTDSGKCMAWFGGGADLTPYYLFDDDIIDFHRRYKALCNIHFDDDGKTYQDMKSMCDEVCLKFLYKLH